MSRRCIAGALLVLTCPAVAARADSVIADADGVRPSISPRNVRVALVPGDGAGSLYRISLLGDEAPARGVLVFSLPEGAKASNSGGVAAKLRLSGGKGGSVRLRWLAIDADGRVILVRRFHLPPAEKAREVSLLWTQWRWGDTTAGGAGEVRKLGLRIEDADPGQQVELDDLRFTAPPGDDAGKAWLLRVAFGGRDARAAEADGLLVATDATADLSDADLRRVLGRMRQARALVRRLFGKAVRPIEGANPPALIIFKEHAEYLAFAKRFGNEWSVEAEPPVSDGSTFQDIAFSTFEPRRGADRPTYLHESVHAVLAHDLRVVNGRDSTHWLHEGLASYAQLCAYPGSLAKNALPQTFAGPIDRDGRGFFKPLDRLMNGPVATTGYVQAATVVAYLIEERPAWLPVIAAALADGKPTSEALRRCGGSFAELEAAWQAWGRARFKPGEPKEGTPMFPVPPELDTPPPGDPSPRGT